MILTGATYRQRVLSFLPSTQTHKSNSLFFPFSSPWGFVCVRGAADRPDDSSLAATVEGQGVCFTCLFRASMLASTSEGVGDDEGVGLRVTKRSCLKQCTNVVNTFHFAKGEEKINVF